MWLKAPVSCCTAPHVTSMKPGSRDLRGARACIGHKFVLRARACCEEEVVCLWVAGVRWGECLRALHHPLDARKEVGDPRSSLWGEELERVKGVLFLFGLQNPADDLATAVVGSLHRGRRRGEGEGPNGRFALRAPHLACDGTGVVLVIDVLHHNLTKGRSSTCARGSGLASKRVYVYPFHPPSGEAREGRVPVSPQVYLTVWVVKGGRLFKREARKCLFIAQV